MNPARQGTLSDYTRLLRRHRLTVVSLGVLCAVAALVLSSLQEAKYEAVAQLSFQEEGQSNAVAGVAAVQTQTASQLAAQGAVTVLSDDVLNRAKADLRTPLTINQLRDMVITSIDSASNLVTVQATSPDKRFATDLANTVAGSTVDIQQRNERRRFAEAARRVELQFRKLRARQTKDNQLAVAAGFFERIASLQTLAISAVPSSVARPASVPRAPASPKPIRNTAFGVLIGLLLGIVVAFARDMLDDRMRDSGEIEAELQFPVIGTIRRDALGRAAHLEADDDRGPMSAEDLEAFRILRANLEFLRPELPPKTILVTSPLPEEGKSTVAASLAMSSAVAGKRTLLVECDLRRPCLAARLSVATGPGLGDYLADAAEPQAVVQLVPVRVEAGVHAGPSSGTMVVEGLAVITAGTHTARPAELLGTTRFHDFLRDVADVYDMVVLDSPPLLSVADTLEIVPLVDAAVICVRADQTTRGQALAAKASLERLPHRPTGLVVTGVSPGQNADYDYYSYTYTSDH